jgi:hypothetical protein
MQIDGLKDYQRRGSAGPFADLPPELQKRACLRLQKMVNKHRLRGRKIERWLYGILCGQAKRLTLNPPTSEWGRSMHRKRGGYAVQERYRAEGRQPTAKATLVRVARQQAASRRADGRPAQTPAVDTVIRLEGRCSRFDGAALAQDLLAAINKETSQVLANDSRFRENNVNVTQWGWEVRLFSIPPLRAITRLTQIPSEPVRQA